MATVRRATHAGSWYTNNASKLEEELDGWLRAAGLTKSADVRGVIAPHAGYSYSGRSAAFAFGNIDPTNISRVFLFGPSHHYYTPKCALTRATSYSTPIGDLPVDQEVIDELKATGKFEMMDLRVDEAEHSMEMHLPYLAKVFKGYEVKVVPILVGALSSESEAMYGRLLAKYIDDPRNFFSVSSDFCHWGSRFSYTYYDKNHGPIYKSIEALDRMGMEIIETGDADSFKRYLQEYENTICGRHPISVFLHSDYYDVIASSALPPASVTGDASKRETRHKKSKWDKVEGDVNNSVLPTGAAAVLSQSTVGGGYSGFAQQKRREAEIKWAFPVWEI